MSEALDLLILDTGQPQSAVVYARFGVDTAIELLPTGIITRLTQFRDRINEATRGRGIRPTRQELATFGNDLFTFLLKGKLLAIYNRLPPQYVRIQVLSNQPDFQSLPWEYLQEPAAPAGPNNVRGVVRVVPTIGQPQPKPRKLQKKVRILFAYADPKDQQSVDWEEMEATIRREFGARSRDNYELDIVEGATIASLAQALLAKPYDIFHFNGHGDIVIDPNGQATGHLLLLKPGSGATQRFSAEKLSLLMTGRDFQLVVLSTCNSSAGNFAKAYAVIAESLVLRGTPAVVANQFAINNSVAATFAKGLYEALLRTGDIDQAVAEGRLLVAAQDRPPDDPALEWGIPTLYRHVGGAQLFES
jgi:hypothetical protein